MKQRIAHKLREWAGRYVPAEIISTVCALGSALVAYRVTGSGIAAALAGSAGEAIGFYSYFAYRDGSRYYRRHKHHVRRTRLALTTYHTVRSMIIEFGSAELLDGLLLRPFCMYAGPILLHNLTAGLLAGKLAADVAFYAFAAAGYELRKRLHISAAVRSNSKLPPDK